MAKHEKFRFKSSADLTTKAESLGISLPWSDSIGILMQPAVIQGISVPNRLAVQPMEGFDSDADGTPGELAFRRYGRYAAGGSGLIWYEACSVVPGGRSNPRQMMITEDNVHKYRELTDHVRKVARDTFGESHRPFQVLQLTHSGRYSRPGGDYPVKIFSENRVLDSGLNGTHPTLPETGRALHLKETSPETGFYSDTEIDEIKEAYINGLKLAEEAGFDAVDVKACHGYLLHEMLYAFDRTDSRYGGSFENRTGFLREVLNTPSNIIKAVRLSAFDLIPHPYGFGMNSDGSDAIELNEVKKLIAEFASVVPLWNITAGVPRYAAHVGRPYDRGAFNAPPPDEHPLEAIARLIRITGELQQSFPDLSFVGTGYSWLRQYYPNVGAGVLENHLATFIGLGRSSFAYPDSPKDLMDNGILDPKKVCISCSKCTEFMRKDVPAGCGVRDGEYKIKDRSQKAEERAEGHSCNTLIIGSGAAALNAALCLWESGVHDILIVTEQWGGGTSNNAGSDKQTYYKMSLDPGVADSALEMAADLCRGGAMHGDIALCEAQHSIQAFYNLVRLGVPFPHTEFGAYPGYKTDHDPRARATSAGPLTSHEMFTCLARKVTEYAIPVHDRIVIAELLTKEGPEGKVIAGAIGIDKTKLTDTSHGLIWYRADHVILATGGPGGIYRDSVYPLSQTGSVGMALKIGARSQNLWISQFGIASVKFRWNLSGSYQQVIPRYFSTDQDGTNEQEFLNSHFPDPETLFTDIFLKGYQWPFDPAKADKYGSSLIDLLVQKETARGRKVFIDYTRNPDGFDPARLKPEAREYLEKSGAMAETPIQRLRLLNQPAIDLYKSHGIDITTEPLEIAVCAQHNNGGLTGDIRWESNIRNLFPIGEVNGSHGITRPGGSALNSGQVGGIRAAMRISQSFNLRGTSTPAPTGNTGENAVVDKNGITFVDKLLRATGTLDHRTALAELQQRMSEHGGPVRNPETIGEQVIQAWDLWRRLNTDLKAVEPSAIVEAVRVFDLCLTHAVYLESIAESIINQIDKQNNILEVYLDENLNPVKEWIPVRTIPRQNLWFEQVWKEFRSSTNTHN